MCVKHKNFRVSTFEPVQSKGHVFCCTDWFNFTLVRVTLKNIKSISLHWRISKIQKMIVLEIIGVKNFNLIWHVTWGSNWDDSWGNNLFIFCQKTQKNISFFRRFCLPKLTICWQKLTCVLNQYQGGRAKASFILDGWKYTLSRYELVIEFLCRYRYVQQSIPKLIFRKNLLLVSLPRTRFGMIRIRFYLFLHVWKCVKRSKKPPG